MSAHRMIRSAVVSLMMATLGVTGCSTDLLGSDAVTNAARTSFSTFLTQVAQAAIDESFGG